MRRCDERLGDAMNDGAMLWGDAMHDEAMRWTMRRCDGRWGDVMHDEAMRCAMMRWTMKRCYGRCGDAMGLCYRIAASSIASPHRP